MSTFVEEQKLKFVEEKYIINVDFPTESIIHVNPTYQTDLRCRARLKKPEDGGLILATEEEIDNYLDGIVSLEFHGRKVNNLRWCKICQTKEGQDI